MKEMIRFLLVDMVSSANGDQEDGEDTDTPAVVAVLVNSGNAMLEDAKRQMSSVQLGNPRELRCQMQSGMHEGASVRV
jgi:hypothetical protein